MAGRAGQRVYERVRDERRKDLAENAWRLIGAHVVWATVTTFVVWIQTGPFMTGLGLGLMIGVLACGWVYWFAIDGSIARRMGGSAEEWTSEELNKLDRRTWKIIDDVAFADFNVDHVVVGPELVLSVETKWASSPVRLDRRGWVHRSHLGQSKSAAGRIQRLLKSRGVERRVVPMLMYWGRGARSLPQDVTWSDDVAVVPGKQASKLIERLESSKRSIESDYPAYRALREYVEKHEEMTRA